jgi:hypothetical protein
MISTSSIIIFGIIVLVAVVVIWKWWKTPVNNKKDDDIVPLEPQITSEEETIISENNQKPPPMVFAVNDQGNLDLTDMSGKILNIGYGAHPKTYIILLDYAEKDTEKIESDTVRFVSKVGDTKLYEVAGRPYIINYTRLN